MPFTVDDFQDLIRLLGEHPEWRAELRRHVLSDELLELPGIVKQIAEQLAALTDRVDQLAARMDQLAARMDQLAARMDQLTARVDQLASSMQALAETQNRMETRLGRVEGEVLELRYVQRAPAYFSRLARRLRVIDTSALADLLDDAVERQTLAQDERHAVLAADLVLTGRRREDDAEVYLLAEVSVGIGPDDVERAADRAAILEKLGRPAMAVVAGRQIIAEAAELATRRGVWWVLDGTPARQP